jgi:hypothetical protein
LLDVKHFFGGAEAVADVERASGSGGVKRDDADVAAAGLGENELDELGGKTFPAIFRIDIDVEQVATVASGIEGMRRPVKDEESSAGDGLAVVEDEPAEVFSSLHHFNQPGRKALRHIAEEVVVRAAGIDKHAMTMAGDDGCVRGSGRASF